MIGTLAVLAVLACVFILIWVAVSSAIDQGFAVLNQQKEFAILVKPKKDIKAEVDWAKLVEGAAKPKPRKKSIGKGLPPGAKKLDI